MHRRYDCGSRELFRSVVTAFLTDFRVAPHREEEILHAKVEWHRGGVRAAAGGPDVCAADGTLDPRRLESSPEHCDLQLLHGDEERHVHGHRRLELEPSAGPDAA